MGLDDLLARVPQKRGGARSVFCCATEIVLEELLTSSFSFGTPIRSLPLQISVPCLAQLKAQEMES